ncbi:hypothetical protein U1872_19680 [Sphingomonas sp. RB3P16]|uniref:hypothetical protein n=1 Tax=Parasphingomonas frigoris TaxID=3096163 RepID=UPI002FCB9FFF
MKRSILPARPALSALLLTGALAGCAAQTATRFPSLLPRAIETRSDAEPEVAIAIAEPEPSTDATVAELHATLAKTSTAFAGAATTAERLASAARGAAAGSERWIAAQTALAELDGYRATTSATLSEIDTLALTRAADAKPDYPAITALHATAQAAFDAQTATIGAIAAQLPSG